MIFEKRLYQEKTVDRWYKKLTTTSSNTLVAVPTGGGKTVILCKLLLKWLEDRPDDNILIISHTKEIVQQDYNALIRVFPPFGVGIYQAGIGRREINKITVAGIHSIYNKPHLFKNFSLCIVDEAHSINIKDSGMYRSFFKSTGIRVTGMSATCFRTGQGMLHEGEGALFDSIAYDLTSISNFNKLIKDGYLTKLISKATDFELDSEGIPKVGGDYNLKQLAKRHDRAAITSEAVKETIVTGRNYKKWLLFAIDISHCEHIAEELINNGIEADFVHSKMEKDRDYVINKFKNGSTRALVSVGVLTTGFDSPNIDLIVLLRPTQSPVLHVQMVGRGLRIAEGKDHCLVLDFAGNTERIGPINNPSIPKKGGKKGKKKDTELKAKKCPRCKALTFPVARFCPVCKHEFLFQTKLKTKYDTRSKIIQEEDNPWIPVDRVMYNIHKKIGSPDSLKVSYVCGSRVFSEWVCLNHQKYAKQKADKWVKRRGMLDSVPRRTKEVYENRHLLREPTHIKIKQGRYVEVTNAKF